MQNSFKQADVSEALSNFGSKVKNFFAPATPPPLLSALSAPSGSQGDINNAKVIENNALKDYAADIVKNMFLGAAGGGALLRGVTGMKDLFKGNIGKGVNHNVAGTTVAKVPVPELEEDEDELDKKAGAADFLHQETLPDVTPNNPTSIEMRNNWVPKDRGFLGFMAGDKAKQISEIPIFDISLAGALGAGGYGGYKLTDWLLGKKKEYDNESDLEQAKKRYRDAIISQYTPEQVKQSNDNSLSVNLDKLSEEFMPLVKQADSWLDWLKNQVGGEALNHYLLGAGTLALGTGIGTYRYFNKQDPEDRLKKVLAQRERERQLRRPPQIYVVPQPVKVQVSNKEEDNTDKFAFVVNRIRDEQLKPNQTELLSKIRQLLRNK